MLLVLRYKVLQSRNKEIHVGDLEFPCIQIQMLPLSGVCSTSSSIVGISSNFGSVKLSIKSLMNWISNENAIDTGLYLPN